jgi:hypothetical protein
MNYFENTTLKPKSVAQFNSKINEWIGYMPPFYRNIICIILFPTVAMDALETHLVINTNTNKHNFFMSILSFMRHRPDAFPTMTFEEREAHRHTWLQLHTANDAPIIQRRLENKPTDNQLKKGGINLTYNDLVAKRNELPLGSIERLLIAMYTMIPPVRADYFATEIISEDQAPKEKNYIRRRGPARMECILTDFKTAKTYKQITNNFPPELIAEIDASLEKTPRNYLFLNANGKPHTRGSYILWTGRLLKRVLGTTFTLVFFRHAFVTNFIFANNMATMTDAEVKLVSDKMGHSPEMFRAYKWVHQGATGELTFEDAEEEKEE